MTPEQALERCRAAGFSEGTWCCDVRAGRCQLETLSRQIVTFTTEHGQTLAIGDATDLYDSYQNGGIQPVDHTP
ncbi:hypothetical protein [Halocatena marina]|uniref:hypothetical protein n=1 Tax=Halocatena marina TaxID=2934937 RepID=UPI00200CBD99|nr:hypothetical protein [Halocatena marina]